MTFQVVANLSNHESLCICEITSREAEAGYAQNDMIDGFGLYLVSIDSRTPMETGRVLAKFSTEDAAKKLAQFFRINGKLEQSA